MADTKVVTPVVQTASPKEENAGITWANNIPDALESLDTELAAGFVMQSDFANESHFRVDYLVKAVVAQNKVAARGAIALYDRSIDGMAKLPVYKKTHTRDQVEQIFLETRDGKIMAENAKVGREYLENHK